MKIIFKSDEDFFENTNVKSKLELSKEDNKLLMRFTTKDYDTGIGDIKNFTFKKDTLKDFIGALLHIQSKLNKNG